MIQEKILKFEGNNIFTKGIYFFYKPYFKKLFTPKYSKSCYFVMLEYYSKDTFKNIQNYATYISYIEKFMSNK
jgi:hypothetical protein